MIKKRIFKTILTYSFILVLLLLPPICFNNTYVYAITNVSEIATVLPKVFANMTFKTLPYFSLGLKTFNCVVLILFFFSKKIQKHFNVYVFLYMLFITLTQNIAYIEDKGFVLSTGSFVLMLVTCFVWLFKIRKEEHHFTINKEYLWMLLIVFICIWYPLDVNARFDFSLNPWPHYLSSTMYCFNMPVFIAFLLMFYKNNHGVFYEIIGIIAFLFSVVTIGLHSRSYHSFPNLIMHFPLLIASVTMLINCYVHKIKNYKQRISKELQAT